MTPLCYSLCVFGSAGNVICCLRALLDPLQALLQSKYHVKIKDIQRYFDKIVVIKENSPTILLLQIFFFFHLHQEDL